MENSINLFAAAKVCNYFNKVNCFTFFLYVALYMYFEMFFESTN